MRSIFHFWGLISAIVLTSFWPAEVRADDFKDMLKSVLETHDQIMAARADIEAARANRSVAEGDLYPTLGMTANWGNERIYTQNPSGSPTLTSMASRSLDLSLSQNLWDFGATNNSVEIADLALAQAKLSAKQVHQEILFEAVSAQLNAISAQNAWQAHAESVANIKKQTQLESARVEDGRGYPTDTLQAKAHLAGALSAIARSEGDFLQALNRYHRFFGRSAQAPSQSGRPSVPDIYIPNDVDACIQQALQNNIDLQHSQIDVQVAKKTVALNFSKGYRPELAAVAEQRYKHNVDGVVGKKTETLVKLELTFDFQMGAVASNTLKASKADVFAAESRRNDLVTQVNEQVRTAWENLHTARENAQYFDNQSNIAHEFLDLARRERELGQRSLIDVLSGETTLVQAEVSAEQSLTQVELAKLELLKAMGVLDLSHIH